VRNAPVVFVGILQRNAIAAEVMKNADKAQAAAAREGKKQECL